MEKFPSEVCVKYIKITYEWLDAQKSDNFTQEIDDEYLSQLDDLWYEMTEEEQDYVGSVLRP